MKRYDAGIAAKWAEANAHRRWSWGHAVMRKVLLEDILDFERRARCEIAAIRALGKG